MTAAINLYIVLCMLGVVLFISLLCVGVALLGTRNERIHDAFEGDED